MNGTLRRAKGKPEVQACRTGVDVKHLPTEEGAQSARSGG